MALKYSILHGQLNAQCITWQCRHFEFDYIDALVMHPQGKSEARCKNVGKLYTE